MTCVKPAGFAAFWDTVDAELHAVDAAVTVHADVRPPTDGVRVHRLTFDSIDGVRVGGWLALPDRDGPHPGLVIFPGYKSDPLPAIGWARRGYATFTLAHRGKLGATEPFNPGYPGLLTHGIDDPHTYAYRGVYADCMRALEVMTDQADVTGPLAVYGYSQGGPLAIYASARRPQLVGAVVAGAPFLTAFAYSVLAARTYPYFEIAEYLAAHPDMRDTVFDTLSYFDALHAIADVKAPLLLFRAGADEICPPYSTTLLRQHAPAGTRWHEYEQSGHDTTGVRAVGDAATFFHDTLTPPKPVTTTNDPQPSRARNAQPASTVPEVLVTAQTVPPETHVHTDDRSVLLAADASTSFVTVTQANGAKAGAYVSVPKRAAQRDAGVIVEFSPYASVVSLPHPEDRERHTMLTLAHRGQRGSGFAAPWMLPGLFEPTGAQFNQLVADNLNLVLTLLSRVHTPGTPVIGVGPDWILAIAALSGLFTHIEIDSYWLTDVGADGAEFEYPRRELHELAKATPEMDAAISWCDPVLWAGQVNCDVLAVCADTPAAKARATRLLDAHNGPHELHVSMIQSALESEWRDRRRSALLGIDPAIRWQSARSGVRL